MATNTQSPVTEFDLEGVSPRFHGSLCDEIAKLGQFDILTASFMEFIWDGCGFTDEFKELLCDRDCNSTTTTTECIFGETTTCAANLCDGLMAYWPLGEASGNRVDSTGNGNDLSPTNSPGNTTGVIGDGLLADSSSSQFVSIATNSDLELAEEFTIAGWFNVSAASIESLLGSNNGGDGAFEMYQSIIGGNFGFGYKHSGGFYSVTDPAFGAPPTGEWIHVAAYRRDGVLYVQVNNETPATMGAPNNPIAVTGATFRIGPGNHNVSYDEIGIWNRALNDCELTALYELWNYDCP